MLYSLQNALSYAFFQLLTVDTHAFQKQMRDFIMVVIQVGATASSS